MQRVVTGMAVILLAFSTTSFRWPVNNGKITSTFGESRNDHFHDGVDMTASDMKIYPAASGNLLLFWDKSLFPLDHYPGGGNFKVLSHGNKQYSVYLHLEDGGPVRKSYSETDQIGIIGNTGHSYGKHVHFTVVDRSIMKSLNPYCIMPALEDVKAPEIVGMHLRIGDKYVLLRENSKIRLTKHYPLLLQVYDSIAGNERVGVYRLVVVMNNRKVYDTVFHGLGMTSRGIALGKKIFSDVFDEIGYYKVDGVKYINGENTVKITACDFKGNVTEKDYLFNVTLDMPLESQ
jgi:hypothetical protein